MRVLVTGGGTAGHVSPLLALAAELREHQSHISVIYVGFKGDRKLMKSLIGDDDFNRTYTISAGKLRRYHGVSWWRQVLDIPTVLSNIRDIFRTVRGVFASVRIMRRERPDVVFAKGGFVSVPVTIAAKITNTPIVTHDSDALPGLANRIAARWATVIATGAPAKYYSQYPADRVIEVGVPVSDDVEEIRQKKKSELLTNLKLNSKKPVVTIIGGTHGGKEINESVLAVLPELLDMAQVVHVSGASNYEAVVSTFEGEKLPEGYRLEKIVAHEDLMALFRVSDLVISRVGASTMAELVYLEVASIIVPNPKLTGGHQIKNAKRFSDEKAAVVLKQSEIVKDPAVLLSTVETLLKSDRQRKSLAKNIARLARPHANRDLAQIIARVARGENPSEKPKG